MVKQPSHFITVCIDGDESTYVLYNSTDSYYDLMNAAFLDIKNDHVTDYSYFGFITLCAATLEFSLNFILTTYCYCLLSFEDYKTHAEGYINLKFPLKLEMSPTIISQGKLKFDTTNQHYKSLRDLITSRNKLLHHKEYLKDIGIFPISEINGKKMLELSIPPLFCEIDKLNKEVCLKYGEALNQFKDCFMTPALNAHLEKNEMLIEV